MTPDRDTASTPDLAERILVRLEDGKRVRRTLPGRGRVHIDRPLPFLCVYRRSPEGPDGGTERLIVGEASYLVGSADHAHHDALITLVRRVTQAMSERFGAFLVLELWAGPEPGPPEEGRPIPAPAFRLVTEGARAPQAAVRTLEEALAEIRVLHLPASVEVGRGRRAPFGLSPLLRRGELRAMNAHLIGLEVRPIHRDPSTGEPYPLVRRALHRGVARALKRTFFEFSRASTSHKPASYLALGRRAVVKAVWEADRGLAEVSGAYDFLLQVTPVNAEQAWPAFRRSGCERAPEFLYRPRPVDPALLKRQLYEVPIERIEDPTLAHLFHEKRAELDGQLTMLADRDTPKFLPESLQVFGGVDDTLHQLALDILDRIPPRARDGHTGGRIGARTFATRAREEIEHYRGTHPDLSAEVSVRRDITGLMVSRGNLLIASSMRIPASRVNALIQHEVGTHVLTYHNGRAQPLRQLYTGLAGYEECQEGLAVFSEYLVGGLSRRRLRLLAARVVAVRLVVEGASFIEVFRELHRRHGMAQRSAYTITMRVLRGGGFTKDTVYLRGLQGMLDHVRNGGDLEPLFVGKIALDHVPVIEELLHRRVLKPAPLRPRYLDDARVWERIDRARRGITVLETTGRTG